MPRRKHQLLHKEFGRLRVVREDALRKNGSWVCECVCGKEVTVKTDHLLERHTQSCGCLAHDLKWKGCGKISGNYWNQVKRHARVRNLQFKITIEEAWQQFESQNAVCALTGLPLVFYTNPKDRNQEQTASLDRIDSTKGYVNGNIQWLHKTVQKMKVDIDEKEFLHFCNLISRHESERQSWKSNEAI